MTPDKQPERLFPCLPERFTRLEWALVLLLSPAAVFLIVLIVMWICGGGF